MFGQNQSLFGAAIFSAAGLLQLGVVPDTTLNVPDLVGASSDCNASDADQWNCVEHINRVKRCNNVMIGNGAPQPYLDMQTTEVMICTQNLCDNVRKEALTGSSCNIVELD